MNIKQAVFAMEYVIDWNSTQAGIRAGYSQRTAYAQGSRLLKDVEVQTEIARHKERQAERADVRIEEIVSGLKSIATDDSAPAAARVSAWKALGEYKNMFASNTQEIPRSVIELLDTLRLRAAG